MAAVDITNSTSYSLLIIIVERGKGSKVLNFARQYGAIDASCLLGKGTVKSDVLQMIEINEVDKEIIVIIIPTEQESDILVQLNEKFHLDQPHHGIAFIISLAGVLKIKKAANIKWKKSNLPEQPWENTALFMVVNKGQADHVVQLSQAAGYYGGTIIKARGTANQLDMVLNMVVEPEKEAVLMIMESQKAHRLADLLFEKLHLDQPNTGFICKMGVVQTLGLYQDYERSEGAGQ